LPHWQVDKGAIKFMFGGAHVMCRGLTSAGGKMVPLPAGSPVAIMAEGKTHALAVGITKMSDAEVRSKNSDIAVENLHQLLDGLFKTERLEG
jgi:PUA domain protein